MRNLKQHQEVRPLVIPRELTNIKNLSLQTLEIYQTTHRGPIAHFVKPNQMIVIPSDEVSTQIKNLAAKRMLKIW